jgi:hypothetical protein
LVASASALKKDETRGNGHNNYAGFTLLEVLMYIAFFTLLMTSLLGVAYRVLDSAGQISRAVAIGREADFILRKIDWALGSARSFTLLGKDDLSIARFSAPAGVEFKASGSYVDLDAGSGFMDLNSQNTEVSNLTFAETASPGEPDKIQVDFDINCLRCPAALLRHFSEAGYLKK